jgi:hypothetical protein
MSEVSWPAPRFMIAEGVDEDGGVGGESLDEMELGAEGEDGHAATGLQDS